MEKSFFDLIVVDKMNVGTSTEVLEKLSGSLYAQKAVNEHFQAAVIEREHNFPTGMPTKIPAALPHTDSEYCLRKALAVGVLEKPVTFGLMGGEDGETIDTKMVFMLSLPNPKSQIVIIQKILEIFREEPTMEMLQRTGEKDPSELRKILTSYFSDISNE
ncbi:PTS system, galactitol-specific IIA component [Pelolinea submarina]|nr:PTS system, galactitol-specific IIA component [Pelolinea submarina]